MSTSDQTKSNISGKVETDVKFDLIMLADERSDPFNRVTLSALVREAVNEYVDKHSEEIPEYDRDEVEEAQMGAA